MAFLNKVLNWILIYRKPIQWILAIISVAIAIKLLHNSASDMQMLLNFRASHLVAILLLFLLQFLISVIPLWLIIKRLTHQSIPIVKWIKIMFVSRMVNNLFTKGGTIYKALVLKNDYQISYTSYVHVYSFFTWLNTLISFGLAALLLLITVSSDDYNGHLVVQIMALGFIITLLGPWLINKLMGVFSLSDNVFGRLYRKIHGVFIAIIDHGRNTVFMVRLLVLTIVRLGVYVVFLRFLFLGMSVEVHFAHLALLVAIQNLSVQISVTPGNIGVRELIFGVIFSVIGIGVTEGVLASALLRIVLYLTIFPFGIAFGGLRLLNWKKGKISN